MLAIGPALPPPSVQVRPAPPRQADRFEPARFHSPLDYFREQRRLYAQRQSLLSPETTASERKVLDQRLARLDPALVRLLAQGGVTIRVVHPGEDVWSLGALRPHTLEEYQARIPAMQAREPQDGRNLTAIPFTLPLSSVEQLDAEGSARSYGKPTSVRRMAQLVGAQSEEQIQEYEGLVRAINPEGTPFEKLQVPDLAYVQGRRVTVNDASSFKNWANARGRTLQRYSEQHPDGSMVDGQFFQGSNRLLILADAVRPDPTSGHGDTLLHELGHGLEVVLETRDPSFHAEWRGRLEKVFATRQQSVSEYAMGNSYEYFAEGVAHYFDQPNQLKKADPELYRLTREFVQHVAGSSTGPIQ